MKLIAIVLLGLSVSWTAFSQTSDAPQLDLPRIKLSAGMHLIDTQVARTNAQRQTAERQSARAEAISFFACPPCSW